MIDISPYISLTTMMVLATKDSEGNPYTANVYFRVDEEYNFYYKSKTHREHSKHIEIDNQVAWSILNTEKYKPTSKDKKWLQFQWVAEKLVWKEAEKVSKELYGKQQSFSEILQNGHLIYKCTPKKVKIWDETNSEICWEVIDF